MPVPHFYHMLAVCKCSMFVEHMNKGMGFQGQDWISEKTYTIYFYIKNNLLGKFKKINISYVTTYTQH